MSINIIETPFFCESNGLRIRGMQYCLDNERKNLKHPAIIVSHGFTGNYTGTADYSREFAKMGYVSFSFSFCGGSRTDDDEKFKSEGESTKNTILTEVQDLIAVKDYVKGLPYIDESKIILAGISQGGLVSGLTAAKCKDEIEKLILICPALCIPDHARRGCLGGSQYDVNDVPEIINCPTIQLGKIFHDTVVDMDVNLELAPYKGPVLILHGLEDEIVNYSYAIGAKENYEKNQCYLQLIKEAGHSFNENQQESIIASIKQFLLERKEILTINVIITDVETIQDGDYRRTKIYFTGYCDTDYFHGAILPDGCDTQEYGLDEQIKIRAEYTLHGIDMENKKCSIHIVNQKDKDEWKPVIKTDSKNLEWLNSANLTAVLEHSKEGPTVRIFV